MLRARRRGAPALELTDRMRGWVRQGDHDPFDAASAGRHAGTSIEQILTIAWPDGRKLLANPSTEGQLNGTVSVPVLHPERMLARGTFRLLVDDPALVETKHMVYDLELTSESNKRFRLRGIKTFSATGLYRPWTDATTLPFKITVNQDTVASGVLRLSFPDLLRLLASIHATGGRLRGRVVTTMRFVLLFVRALLRLYGGPLDEWAAFPELVQKHTPKSPGKGVTTSGTTTGFSPLPAPTYYWCGGDPGSGTPAWHVAKGPGVGTDAWLRLTHYQQAERSEKWAPVILAHAFAMSADSFATNIPGSVLPVSLAQYLYHCGYDVWLFDYRASIALPSSRTQFSLDDVASMDWPTAIDKIRSVSNVDKVHAYGHCVGSATLTMALLSGVLANPDRVDAAVCSQVGLFVDTSLVYLLRSFFPFGPLFHTIGLRLFTPFRQPTTFDYLFDLALRMVPVPRGERCRLGVCRWVNAIYGLTHRHSRLDDATHDALWDLFGVGNLEALEQLDLILKKGRLLTTEGGERYFTSPQHVANVPMLYVQGDDNYIFRASGTFTTREWLEKNNPGGHYGRLVLPGYGHLDTVLGRDAARDVFPAIAAFFDAPEPFVRSLP